MFLHVCPFVYDLRQALRVTCELLVTEFSRKFFLITSHGLKRVGLWGGIDMAVNVRERNSPGEPYLRTSSSFSKKD
jgi:hypothetical protein